jgi:hypothetical protein
VREPGRGPVLVSVPEPPRAALQAASLPSRGAIGQSHPSVADDAAVSCLDASDARLSPQTAQRRASAEGGQLPFQQPSQHASGSVPLARGLLHHARLAAERRSGSLPAAEVGGPSASSAGGPPQGAEVTFLMHTDTQIQTWEASGALHAASMQAPHAPMQRAAPRVAAATMQQPSQLPRRVSGTRAVVTAKPLSRGGLASTGAATAPSAGAAAGAGSGQLPSWYKQRAEELGIVRGGEGGGGRRQSVASSERGSLGGGY